MTDKEKIRQELISELNFKEDQIRQEVIEELNFKEDKIRQQVIDELNLKFVSAEDYMEITLRLGHLVRYGRLINNDTYLIIPLRGGDLKVSKTLPTGFVIKTAGLIQKQKTQIRMLELEVKVLEGKNQEIYPIIEDLKTRLKVLEDDIDFYEKKHKFWKFIKKLFK